MSRWAAAGGGLLLLLAGIASAGDAEGWRSIRERRYFEPVDLGVLGSNEEALAFVDGEWHRLPMQLASGHGQGALILGESVGAQAPPEQAARLRELHVRDPIDGDEAFVYLGVAPPGALAAPVEATKAVAYDADSRTIRARCYRIGFDDADPALFTSLAVTRDCGGSERNMVAGVDTRASARLIAVGSVLERGRQDLLSRVVAVSPGPVSLTRSVAYRVRLPFGLTSAETVQEAHFYPYHYTFPVHLDLPAVVDWVVSGLDVEFSSRWRADLAPLRFVTGSGARATIDGRTTPEEEALDGAPFTGWRVDGASGRFVNLLALDGPCPFEALLRYRDDVQETKESKSLGLVGFVLHAKGDVSGHAWSGTSTTIVPRPGDERGPEELERLLAAPLVVEGRVPPTAQSL